jgi:hypothetical protein
VRVKTGIWRDGEKQNFQSRRNIVSGPTVYIIDPFKKGKYGTIERKEK